MQESAGLLLVLSLVLSNAILHVWSQGTGELLLACGDESGAKDLDGRQWSPDGKYLSQGSSSIASKATYQDPSLISQVPYMTARIFESEATYKFPIQPDKRYWLRLHFYPSSYGSHDSAYSYFSVTANSITLLSNFSASITCLALSQAYIDREYSLAALGSDTLTLTFRPADKIGAFAFVNGIQLIQMPDLFGSASMVGFDQTLDAKSMHLQTMFRLNVGGKYISPTQDSGLTRMWYDDYPYLYGASTGITTTAPSDVKLNYQSMPQYTAPSDVYLTSRSMGSDKNLNMGYNLTWIFQIDPNSMYLVRMHFCDYYNKEVNELAFNVFLNSQTAETGVDVIAIAGGKGIPLFKDFVVYSKDGDGSDQLWVALHPNDITKPSYLDAILNGLEIFKLSDTDLSGPNPTPSDMLNKFGSQGDFGEVHKHLNKTIVIGGAAGGAAGFALVAAICVALHRKKKYAGQHSRSSWLPVHGNSSATTKSSISGRSVGSCNLTAMAQGLCRHFSLHEMKQATKNFNESNVIGVGGFGKVYKGTVDNGTKVAIKRSNPESEQGVNEFQTEIEMLSKLRHKHLVSLIGFCEENDEMCLVYDYMAMGTFREHLYKGNKRVGTLSWKQRLEICIGAARGLHYLHTGAKYTIIHRDGSFGYLDPEYFRRQQLTEKSDVYSFGVVLCEALCARPVLNPSLPKEQVSLAEWVLLCKRRGTLEEIIDPSLKGKINPESLKKFVDTAEKCLSDVGVERPSMNDLLWNLEFALTLQENGSTQSSASHSRESGFEEISLDNKDTASHSKSQSLGGQNEPSQQQQQQDSTIDNSDDIYSQFVNLNGR
ncbi:hypothetical protein PIB30_018035 [Stylosanthes scabra]|uniref:Protein kinase domain-containing protein n=1 Tax=Stylosanthes scabra TaxID=79078 RepID=A0ABU6W7Y7_9FABA|nr:hypothetical protein [Stylosanthes scabra]